MGGPSIVFVSREVYPFESAGLGNYVASTAGALASVAEVRILTSERHRAAYEKLRAHDDPRLPPGVEFAFIPEPTDEEVAGWYGHLHLWGARVLEALRRLYPDGGPQLVEFPDYLGEAAVTAQAVRGLDPRLRHTRVCVRAYTSSEMCSVLNGYVDPAESTRLLFDLERLALREADHFLWPGGDVLGAYSRFYGAAAIADPVLVRHVVSPGPRPSAASSSAGDLRLLFVGRLERRKGVQNLIRAATALPGSDWSLTLVGGDTDTAPLGGSMRDQLELMIAGDPRIRISPRIPRERVRELIAESHVLVSPSLWECWPNTVLEALEQNRPVLATSVGGHAELVAEGESGWQVPGTSASALGEALERLLGARGEAEALSGGGGPRRVFERLTEAEPVREAYLRLAEPRRRVRPAAASTSRPVPLVTVVIPYFRMEAFVEEALASVSAQTHPRIETILVNDGSLRREDAILDRLTKRYPVAVVTQVNSGLGQARNLGIALARGRYVCPLDPDDVLRPSFLSRCVALLEADPELAYATTWTEYVAEDGGPYAGGDGYQPLGNAADSILEQNVGGSAMAVIRRRVFERGFAFSPDMTAYEDWLFYLQLRSAGLLGRVVPERLAVYRVRRRSMLRELTRRHRRHLQGELVAHRRESEIAWVPSSA